MKEVQPGGGTYVGQASLTPFGNALVPQLLGAFWTVYRRVAGVQGWTDDPAPDVTVRRHRDIVVALRARDIEGAQ
jgi:DNA-binding FadR family transcriptional regulator